MILLIAVESPLLPHNGDDFLDGIVLFSRDCLSILRHQNIEAVRYRLRLVCRVWDAVLQDEGAHISYMYVDHLHRIQPHCDKNRKIRRIELAPYCTMFGINCGPRCTFPRYLPMTLPPTFEDLQWIEHLQLLRGDFPTKLTMDILDKATRLRALDLQVSDVVKEKLSDVLNHPNLTQITHLSIGSLGTGYGDQQVGPASFPAVQYLSIQISGRLRQKHLLDWKFPSLTSFRLQRKPGPVDLQRERSREDHAFYGLQRFLASHSKQIASLNIEYGHLGYEIGLLANPIDETFWSKFPSLRLFGPGMSLLDNKLVPPPPEVQLESLAILGLPTRPEDNHFRIDPYIDRLVLACSRLRVKKLIMLASWEDMASGSARIGLSRMRGTYVFCLSSSAWPERLFQEAEAKGINVFDINRVPITDPEGQLFLEKLRNPRFRE
jgi:hypothetical protein